MKLNKIILSVLAFATALIACEKAGLRLTEYSLPTDKAFVKVALFSPGTPNVMIKANDVKLNGANTSGTIGFFPLTATFPDYVAVVPNATIKLSLPNTGTQNDSTVLFTSNLGGLEANKFYALTLCDTGVNRTVFATEDVFLPQRDSFLSVRLINATVGSNLTFIRVDSNSATDVVRDTLAKNIPFKGSSGFISVKTFTTRSFIRLRAFNANGLNIGGQVIPPQTLATGSRRSITVYTSGILGSTVISLAPFMHNVAITNQ
jgi:hypothetical protein